MDLSPIRFGINLMRSASGTFIIITARITPRKARITNQFAN